MEGVANCAAYGTRATCYMLHATWLLPRAPCALPHGQIARNSACKMHKISFYFAHNLLSTRGSQRCVRQCVCLCEGVCVRVCPCPCYLAQARATPFVGVVKGFVVLGCSFASLSSPASASASAHFHLSPLQSQFRHCSALIWTPLSWQPLPQPQHRQLRLPRGLATGNLPCSTHTRLAKHFIIAFLN